MLEEFREFVGKAYPAHASTLRSVELRLGPWLALDPSNHQLDVESVLEAIAFLTNPREVGPGLLQGPAQEGAPSRESLLSLREAFLEYIRQRCLVPPTAVEPYDGFKGFFRDYTQILVFTVNYDIIVEQLVSKFGLEYTDGFRLRWSPNSFEADSDSLPKICIYKLHGSAVWFRSPALGHLSMPIRSTGTVLIDGSKAEPLMMYPAQKWEYERPFYELLGMFSKHLEDVTNEWVVIAGYSFRDEHLNRVLRDAATRNPNLFIALIGPSSDTLYRRRLSQGSFGWRTEPGTEPGALPESPLTDRVVRIPFAYELVLADFAREGFASLRQALTAYIEAREAAETKRDQPWLYIATRLAEEGVIDLLPDVESRLAGTFIPDTSRVGYELTKAAAYHSLGRSEDAEKAWGVFTGVVADWFGPRLSPVIQFPAGTVDFGFEAEVAGMPPGSSRARHGLSNIPQFISRPRAIFTRHLGYLKAADPRKPWLDDRTGVIQRLDEYCAQMTSPMQLTRYLEIRRGTGGQEATDLGRLLASRPSPGAAHTEASIRILGSIDSEILQLVRSIESRVMTRDILMLGSSTA
jgi:hypothetical protein